MAVGTAGHRILNCRIETSEFTRNMMQNEDLPRSDRVGGD